MNQKRVFNISILLLICISLLELPQKNGIIASDIAFEDNTTHEIQQLLLLFDPLYRGTFENYYEFVEHWLDFHGIKWEYFHLATHNITIKALEPYDAIIIPVISGPKYQNVIARFLDENEWAILEKYPVYIAYTKDWEPPSKHFLIGGTGGWGRWKGDFLLGLMVRQLGLITVPTQFGFDIDDLVHSDWPWVTLDNLNDLTSMMRRHGVTAYAGIRPLDLSSKEIDFLIANQDILIPTLHQHKKGQLGGDLSYSEQKKRWTNLIDEMQDQGFDIDYNSNNYCIPPNHAYNEETLQMLSDFNVKYMAVEQQEHKRATTLDHDIIGLPRSMFLRMNSRMDSREDILERFEEKFYKTDWEGYKVNNLNNYLREYFRKLRIRVVYLHDANIVNDEPGIDVLDFFFSYFENRGNVIFVNSVELGDYLTSHYQIINTTRAQKTAIVFVNGSSENRCLFVPNDPTTGYRFKYGDVQIYHVGNEQLIDYQIEKTTQYGVYLKLLNPRFSKPHFIENSNNKTYVKGTKGLSITWNAWDAHPSRYIILQNNHMVANESWDNSPIIVKIDYLSPGSYSFVCIVTDSYGNLVREVIYIYIINPGKAPIHHQDGFHEYYW